MWKEVNVDTDILLVVDEGQPANAARFFSAGVHLLELLDDLADTAEVDWQVTDLRLSSAVSGLAAVGDHRDYGIAAARATVRGLKSIRDVKGLPDDWTPNAVAHAKDLVRKAGEDAHIESGGEIIPFDRHLREQLDSIAPWVREFYGSVRGTLTGVNVTRGNRASLKPAGGGRIVHIGFPNSLQGSMRTGLLEFVEVEGMLRQNEDGRTYFISAEDIAVVEAPAVSWQDLRGYMPELTGGLSVDEYLREIHGED